MIDFLLDRFSESSEAQAIIFQDQVCTFGKLLGLLRKHERQLVESGIRPGAIVSLEADFSANSISLLLALIQRRCVIAPLTPVVGPQADEFRKIAEVEWIIAPDAADGFVATPTRVQSTHELIGHLRNQGDAGLILFSSGSTGKSKAAIHSWRRLLLKFQTRRKCLRTVAVLLFDHIGGIDTLFYSLSNASCLIIPEARTPEAICRAIQKHRAEVLPASPSFLNLLLLSEAHNTYDLSSVQIVTYGAEVMPELTLKQSHRVFPKAVFLQKYGTTEIGAMRSRSRSSDSLWVKIGGEGYETRVVHGMLEVKADSAMLGYLNAPSPFTPDGWFRTGDSVEVDGEFIRILGRQSEMINVGGEKVFPQEVEAVLLDLENVADATVFGEKHPILGQIVVASIALKKPEEKAALRKRVQTHCRGRLPDYKIPVKVVVRDGSDASPRFKKMRLNQDSKA